MQRVPKNSIGGTTMTYRDSDRITVDLARRLYIYNIYDVMLFDQVVLYT